MTKRYTKRKFPKRKFPKRKYTKKGGFLRNFFKMYSPQKVGIELNPVNDGLDDSLLKSNKEKPSSLFIIKNFGNLNNTDNKPNQDIYNYTQRNPSVLGTIQYKGDITSTYPKLPHGDGTYTIQKFFNLAGKWENGILTNIYHIKIKNKDYDEYITSIIFDSDTIEPKFGILDILKTGTLIKKNGDDDIGDIIMFLDNPIYFKPTDIELLNVVKNEAYKKYIKYLYPNDNDNKKEDYKNIINKKFPLTKSFFFLNIEDISVVVS